MGNPPLLIDVFCRTRCSKPILTLSFKIATWILTFLAYTTYHLSRKPISVVKSVLHENCTEHNDTSNSTDCHSWKPFDHSNSDELLGSLDYAFLFAYAVGMFFSGHIAERVNVRYFLALGMFGSGIFCAMFGMAFYWKIHTLSYFLAVQIFAGLFQSSGWPSVVTCMGNWFGKAHRGLLMGIWNAHTSVGNILGGIIPGFFVQTDWGLSFIVPGAIIFGMGIVVLLFLVPEPQDIGLDSPNVPSARERNEDNHNEGLMPGDSTDELDQLLDQDNGTLINDTTVPAMQEKGQAITIFGALAIPGVVEYSLSLFFAKLVSYTFLFWLPNYIKASSHIDAEKSADLATVFDFGGIFGAIVAGTMSDFFHIPGLTCVIFFILAAPMMFVYQTFGADSLADSIAMLFFTGALVNGPYGLITTAVSANLGTHPSLLGSARALATVTAIIDGTGSMGAALGPLLTGLLKPYGWKTVFYMLIGADILAFLMLSRVVYQELQHMRSANRSQ